MNSHRMAEGYLQEARLRLETARRARDEGAHAYAVRQSQECVELCLKGMLRFVGIEPPRWHDVGAVLRENLDRFPEAFRERVDKWAFISRELRADRETSMYGDEALGLAPSQIYSAYDANVAVARAEEVYMACADPIGGTGNKA